MFSVVSNWLFSDTVFRLRGTAYVRRLNNELEDCWAVVCRWDAYNTLESLERRGLVSSTLAKGPEGRGGRTRRYYTVIGRGIEAMNFARATSETLWQGISWPISAPSQGPGSPAAGANERDAIVNRLC